MVSAPQAKVPHHGMARKAEWTETPSHPATVPARHQFLIGKKGCWTYRHRVQPSASVPRRLLPTMKRQEEGQDNELERKTPPPRSHLPRRNKKGPL